MIPKIINTFWGGKRDIHRCTYIDNWVKILKPNGYEINVMTDSDVDKSACEFVEYTLTHKYWAHLSDYYRFDLLYNNGGFWLDADILIHKPFDDLLSLEYVFAKSHDLHKPKTKEEMFKYEDVCLSCFATSPQHQFMQFMLNHYKAIHIVEPFKFNMWKNIIGNHFNSMIKENNISIDYNTYYKFEQNIIPIKKILLNQEENKNILYTLPAVMFDMYTNQKIHKNQYASHMHHGLWT